MFLIMEFLILGTYDVYILTRSYVTITCYTLLHQVTRGEGKNSLREPKDILVSDRDPQRYFPANICWSSRHVFKMFSRRLGDKQNAYLYLKILILYLINLYLTYLYLINQGESKMH